MKHTDTELEEILNQLIASTRSPRGRFSAAASYPELEKRLKSHTRHLTLIRTFSAAAAVALLCLSVWTAYLYMQPAAIQTISTLAETRTVRLPDGSSVMLNHYSSLSYPEKFQSDKREVELNGEAYFEVAFDSLKPFIVMTGGMEVQVLGTKFNIKAYTDDQAIFTTLVSGSVQIKERESAHTALLRPDEQCIYTTHDGRMRIHTVDPQVSLGWIHGRFVFENETLEEILKQLGRWYDVKIFFRDPQVAGYRFTGNVGRFDQISTLLRMIEKAYDISFTISDDTVIVSKK